jgi:hypothetical protein
VPQTPPPRRYRTSLPSGLAFELGSQPLSQQLRDGHARLSCGTCLALFRSLACHRRPALAAAGVPPLHDRAERVPDEWQASQVVHPYVYDSHLLAVVRHRDLLETPMTGPYALAGADYRSGSEQMTAGHARLGAESLVHRMATYLLQTGLVVLAVALGVPEEQVKLDIRNGILPSLLQVGCFLPDSTRKIP